MFSWRYFSEVDLSRYVRGAIRLALTVVLLQATITTAWCEQPTAEILLKNAQDAGKYVGSSDKAIILLNELIQRDPDFLPAYYWRGYYYGCQGKHAEENADLTYCISKLQDRHRTAEEVKLLASAYLTRAFSKDFATAYDDSKMAVELNPSDSLAQLIHGKSCLPLERYLKRVNLSKPR